MDNLSELDDCINTLEQLQLTLDFETSTVKRNPRLNTSPMSPRVIHMRPVITKFDPVPCNQNDNDGNSFENQQLPDLTNSTVARRVEKPQTHYEDKQYPNVQMEVTDLQSVSVRRPKLSPHMPLDNELFSVPECDSTDFPPPPPPLTIDNDNYLKSYSAHTLHSPRTANIDNPSPLSATSNTNTNNNYNNNNNNNNNRLFHTTIRKQSTTSMKLSPKPLVEPFNTLQTSGSINAHQQSASQANISTCVERDLTGPNSFHGADSISVREDATKQTVVRFFTTDKTTKAMFVTENMSVEQVIKMLMEKHFWIPSLKSAVVEKVPSLKMERFLEEDECLLTCINSWPATCANMIFFEPREDTYGLFDNAKMYLGENYPSGSMNVDAIKNLFITLTTEEHEYQDYLYLKKQGDSTWKRKFCLLNHHGIFSIQKKKSKSTSPLTIMTFDDKFYLYTSTGGWTKQWDAPTPFGFAFKPYSVVDPKSDQILMFCAGDEVSMKRWCSNLRLCKYKNQILNNYQHLQNRSIYCSNLCSTDNQVNRFLSPSPSPSSPNPKYNFSNRTSLPTSTLTYSKTHSAHKFKF